jgi:hypothetical protein
MTYVSISILIVVVKHLFDFSRPQPLYYISDYL